MQSQRRWQPSRQANKLSIACSNIVRARELSLLGTHRSAHAGLAIERAVACGGMSTADPTHNGTDNRNNGTDNPNNATDNGNNGTDNPNNATD